MGGNKNTNTSDPNGSRLTDEATKPTNDRNTVADENYVTIRINKSHLFGAGCALFGALLVIAVQKYMGIGSPHPVPDHFHSTKFQETTSSSYSSHHVGESRPTEYSDPLADTAETEEHTYHDAQHPNEYHIPPKKGRHPVSIVTAQYICLPQIA